MNRPFPFLFLLVALGCKGEAGPLGNQGSVGAPGVVGGPGPTGEVGPIGEAGMDGANGLEGGTPFLLTNSFVGVIQYGDGDAVIPLGEVSMVAPANGGFMLRVHYRGSVAKRDGIGFCRVAIRVRQNDDLNPLLEEIVGIHGAPTQGKLDLSVGGTLVGLVQLPAGNTVRLRLEIQRFDERCADGAGPTQVARIAAQIDASFHRFVLATE